VIAHLVEDAYAGDLADAFGPRWGARRRVCARGHAPRRAGPPRRARMNVPLVVGLGDGESFLASDVAAILEHTRRVIFLDEGDVPMCGRGASRSRASTVRRASDSRRNITWSPEAAEKGGYAHFMLKEMYEQPQALLAAITAGDARRCDPPRRAGGFEDVLRSVERIELVACGSAFYASLVGATVLQSWTGCRRARPSARSSGTARRRSTAGRSSSRSPVRRDGRHDRPGAPRPRARMPDRRITTRSGRRSRARRIGCCSSRRGLRSRLRHRRRS